MLAEVEITLQGKLENPQRAMADTRVQLEVEDWVHLTHRGIHRSGGIRTILSERVIEPPPGGPCR